MELFYKRTTGIANKKGDYRPRGHQHSWSGRHDEKWESFCPKSIEKQRPDSHKKEKIVEPPKKALIEEEAQEFLKVIWHSEGIINNITIGRHLSFSEEEVPTEGKTHNQPLHIVVKCGNYMIARVLLDNGSSLNVMSKTTLDKLYAPGAILNNISIIVRAFDGSKREVMDIRPAYNCLLGRPWIHVAGAIPSSLHQKVKFVADGRLISIMGEKEMMVSTPLPIEYMEGDEEALKTSFQALEIMGTTSVEGEKGIPKPSKAAIMAAKILISNGFEPGKGLGKKLDSIAKSVKI
ncbi:hypothetical protein CR513_47584, partial [Mucuna pruriens]